ncbi:MAG TPA: PPC domain-containing protein [Pirellulales bacterium]|jgi:hypothetical protein|nr:PPC domain-containing protein [Pirellulales bacterium]
MLRFLAAALAVACCLCGAMGNAQVPKLKSAIPTGIVPGQPVNVTFTGEALNQPTGLWTNLPGCVKLAPGIDQNGDQPGSVTYCCELPANSAPGIYGIRLATGQGISNVRLLVVDDLPTVLEAPDNASLAKAQQLQLPVAVEGAAKAESRQYYTFHVEAGTRLSVEVLARRLGSPLDSFVRLLDGSGNELVYSDDDEATGADSRFVHRFETAGDYYLEIGDIRYYGDAEYRYRLRLGDFPLVTAPFPLGVQAGSVGRIEVTGKAIVELPPIEARAPASTVGARDTERLRIKAEYPGGQGSSVVTLVNSPGLEQVEFEPNDRLETASPVDPVGAVNGRFAADHDRDYFRFTAKKADHLLLLGRTRSLGIAHDLLLRLFDSNGKQVAQGVPTSNDESQIDILFSDAGLYTLSVEDLLGRGGPDHVYRVEFAPAIGGFSLSTDSDRYNVPRGGVFQITVTAVRSGYTGPIELALATTDTAFKLAGAVIPEGTSAGVLTVTVPDSLPPGSWQTFQVVGRATIEKQPFEARAGCLASLRKTLNGMSNPPSELDGTLMLGIGPVFPQFIKLDADDKIVLVPQLAGKASFKVKATRLEKFDGPISLTVEELPAGFALAAPNAALIKKGENDTVLEVTAPLAVAEGDHPIRVVGTGTHSLQPGRGSLDLTLRVVKPVTAAATQGGATPAETSPAKGADP